MRHFADTFSLAPAPQTVLDNLRTDDPFTHTRRHTFGCLFSERALMDRGSPTRAIISIPAQITAKAHEHQLLEWSYAQLFRPLFKGDLPDFVVFFDKALWHKDTPLEREQLCFHELCHVKQRLGNYSAPQFEKNGRPRLYVAAHDVEVFHQELQRYGSIVPSFDDTAISIAIGAKRYRRLNVA